MIYKHHRMLGKILSITFFLLTLIEMVVQQGQGQIIYFIQLLMLCLLCYYLYKPVTTHNHKRILMALTAYMITYGLLILINFINYPIAFSNTEQIIFTIGFNIVWFISYIYYLHHPKHENAMFMFIILTTVLVMFRSFSNAMRLIAAVRGISEHALLPIENFGLTILSIALVINFFSLMYLYLYRYHKNIQFNQ